MFTQDSAAAGGESFLQRQQRVQGDVWGDYNAKVQNAYKQFLGRDGSAEELQLHHANNPNGWNDPNQLQTALGNIQNSDEAKAYAEAQKKKQAAGGGGGNASGGGGSAGGGTSYSGGQTTYTPAPAPPPPPPRQQIGAYTFKPIASAGPMASYAAPQQAPQSDAQRALVARVLANPETLGADQTNAMKMASKESALGMADQLRGDSATQLASRGFDSGGGMAAAGRGQLDAALVDQLIRSNRDIDLTAAATNRADQLNALGVSDSLLNSEVGRATQNFQAALTGDMAADDASFRRDSYNTDQEYNQYRDNRQMVLQEWLADAGVHMDARRLDQVDSQFEQTFGLSLMQFLESQRQHNNGMGFNYASLNANSQNALMNFLAQQTGGR